MFMGRYVIDNPNITYTHAPIHTQNTHKTHTHTHTETQCIFYFATEILQRCENHCETRQQALEKKIYTLVALTCSNDE